MYFTIEDYRKIENWLQANSVKDTEFPEASSLSLNEQLTIIQRGENKRIKLEDLVNFLFSQSDSELDTSSTKPIQNQAVARAIYELQNRKFIEIVEELPPTSNAKDNVVYILLDEVGEDNNLFTEWIKVNNTWEKVGEFKAEIDLSPYLKIQDSPFEKGSTENSAVLKGGNNKATNDNEVALGKYNISNSDTRFSIGIGTSDTNRKNAVEVKVNGDIYIEGVEGRIQDKLNATDTLDTQLTELSNKVDDLPQGDDFDKEGNYPLLHVGTADDLAGRGESVPAEFGFRASGGKSIKDGRAYIKRIKGNSVVWNQVHKNGDFSEGNLGWYAMNGNSFVVENGVVTITIESEPTSNSWAYIIYSNSMVASIVGHKYLYSAECYLPKVSQMQIYKSGSTPLPIADVKDVPANVWTRIEGIGETNDEGKYATFAFYPRQKDTYTIGDQWKCRNYRIIDLTLMFGAGNEPTTIEEFYARVATLGVDMNAYNEGEVIHCNTESIKSVGDNAWDGSLFNGYISDGHGGIMRPDISDNKCTGFIRVLPNMEYYIGTDATSGRWGAWYDKDKNFISGLGGVGPHKSPSNAAYMRMTIACNNDGNPDTFGIYLVHSGWKQDTDAGYQPYWQDILPLPIICKYFSDGMKLAGIAHDEIRFNKASGKWEYSKGKIKSVDLGTLSWRSVSSSGGGQRFRASLSDIRFASTAASMGNMLCSAYTTVVADDTWHNVKGIAAEVSDGISLSDSAYTDAAALKASLQGVILYYESNDWEWEELDAEDQNFRDYYNVADFGTEMSQSSVPSAPFSADIIYQFNAVDMIREHELEITELQNIIATMQAQLASLTSNF